MHSSTKATLKLGLAGLFCAVIAAIPGTAFYLLWSWAVAQVPAAFAYAWAVKLGITLVMVLIGGGFTVGLTIFCGAAALALAAVILD